MITLTKENLHEHVYVDLEPHQSNNLGIHQRSENVVVDGVEIKQSVSLLHESTGAMVWRSSIEFAKYLACPSIIRSLIVNKAVVELGCGTGALARLISSLTTVYYATDQKPLLKLAKHNTENCPRVTVLPFDWELDEWSDIDVECIITCDTIYNEYLVPHLIDAIKSVQNGASIPTILVIQVRELDMLLSSFEKLIDAFEVVHHKSLDGVAMYTLGRTINDLRSNS